MRVAILTVDSMAGHLATIHLMRKFGDRVVAVFVFAEVRSHRLEKISRLWSLLKKSSLWFLLYRALESVGFRFLRRALLIMPGVPVGDCRSVARSAKALGIPVRRVDDTRDPEFSSAIQECGADVVVSAYLTQIIPAPLLSECQDSLWLNVHSSRLPELRGSAPYFWALATGLKETGVTVHKIDGKLDAGAIHGSVVIPIMPQDTVASLHLRLVLAGACTLCDLIERLGSESVRNGVSQQGGKRRYNLPTSTDLRLLRRSRHRLMCLRDVVALARTLVCSRHA